MTFFAGLSLSSESGRALSVIQLVEAPTSNPPVWSRDTGKIDVYRLYHLRHLQRLDSDELLQTTLAQVGGVLAVDEIAGRCTTIADVTDYGRPLAMALRQTLPAVLCVTVSESADKTAVAGGYVVARREMTSALRLALESGALRIAPPMLRTLNSDAAALDSLALVCWWCERTGQRGHNVLLAQFGHNLLTGRLQIKST